MPPLGLLVEGQESTNKHSGVEFSSFAHRSFAFYRSWLSTGPHTRAIDMKQGRHHITREDMHKIVRESGPVVLVITCESRLERLAERHALRIGAS